MGGGYPERITIVYMSSGVFRGKESSNRIELSQLVQDLLNLVFWTPCSCGEGAGEWGHLGASGGMAGVQHACTCMHAHVYMYGNCKWLPTWRHPCLACLTCMCMHVYMHGIPPTPLYPPHPHPPICHSPRGDPWNQLKFNNT